MSSSIIPVLIVFVVIGIPVICVTLIVLARILKSNGGGNASSTASEDLKTLREIHRNLSRMEERIEALETIIIQRHKKSNS